MKRIILSILLSLGVAFTSSARVEVSDEDFELAMSYQQMGSEAIDQNDFSKAYGYFLKAVETNPNPGATSFSMLAIADMSFYGFGTKKDPVRSGAIWFALGTKLLKQREEYPNWIDPMGEKAIKTWNKNVNSFSKTEEKLAKEFGLKLLKANFIGI
ncbi:hypothetical protein [Alteromonas macleodii]|uniref:hypothetical protein n=1 Tax=Alteromonas macleodii TaxID=28108 RepID=UPI00313D954A